MDGDLKIGLRPMRPSDHNLVLRSWLTSYVDSRDVAFYTRYITRAREPYFEAYGPVVEAIMSRSVVMIAHLAENEDADLGWTCTEGELLHFVFVKPRWRRLGVARRLLEGAEDMALTYTHATFLVHDLPVPEKWVYKPNKRYSEHEEAA